MKTVEDLSALWIGMIDICQKLTMGSSVRRFGFDRKDFQDDAWAFIGETLKPFEKLGWVEPRKCGRYITEFVVRKDKFNTGALRAHVDRRKKPRRKSESPLPAAQPAPPSRIVALPALVPTRREVPASVSVIVDLANVTKRCDERERPLLHITRIKWRALLTALQTIHGKILPVERAVLCVSSAYYARHGFALQSAKNAGFDVDHRFGQKEGDPVVAWHLIDAVLGALLSKKENRIPTIVLVSGDQDFSSIILALREHCVKAGLEFKLRVVSWRESLSYALNIGAGEVTHLDDMVERIRA